MNPFLRLALTLACIIFPPIYLAYRPESYTPLVDTMFSIFLTFLAYGIGQASEAIRAKQQANDRWLPQAESVIFRLMTLHANVCGLSRVTKTSCSQTECDMPELQTDKMRGVRAKLKADCTSASQRLDDIAHQLEDAIADWRRFVDANCAGDDCSRIAEAVDEREAELAESTLCVEPQLEAKPEGEN